MGDCMCEDYDKARENRERQAQDVEPYYWWELPDPFPAKGTVLAVNPNGLVRSRSELMKRQGVKNEG